MGACLAHNSLQVEQEGGYVVRLGNRIDDLEVYEYSATPGEPMGHTSKYTYFEDAANACFYPQALNEYLREVKAGGNTERVVERYYIEGHMFTVWRPHAAEWSQTIKTSFKNPRYDLTLAQIQDYTCDHCGYGTSSIPWTILPEDVEVPISLHFKPSDGKKLRNLKKKLRDINMLKERQSAGETLEANQLSKISTYGRVGLEAQELEAKALNRSFISPVDSTGVCHFAILNDDVLLAIASQLPDESLLNLAKAYPPVQALIRDTHVLLQRELKCFFLRTPLNNPTNLLGIGVKFDHQNHILESSFDWLSMEAFELFGIRHSVDKKEFDFFLPLGFSAPHFDRAYESGKLFEYLDKIENVVRRLPTAPILPETKVERALLVLYKFCNSIVVSLMRTTDEVYVGSRAITGTEKTLLFASEKACIGYLQIYHLLLCIMRKDPELRDRALKRLKAFCGDGINRTKSATPDLGEFLVMAAVVAGSHNPENDPPEQQPAAEINDVASDPEDGWTIAGKKQKMLEVRRKRDPARIPGATVSWKAHLAGPFISEVLTRNAKWLLQKHPSLAILEDAHSPPQHRLRTTFAESRTSLRLVMFQVFFLETFATISTQYGFPDADVPARITAGIKEIYAVNGWKMFYERIGLTEAVRAGPQGMSARLREAIVLSAERSYHRSQPARQWALVAERRRVEPSVMLGDQYSRGSARRW